MANAREFLSAVRAGDLDEVQRLSCEGWIGENHEKHYSCSDNIG